MSGDPTEEILIPLAIGAAALSPPRNTGRAGLASITSRSGLIQGLPFELQKHTSDSSSREIREERELLQISPSSAYSPWSVVHTCVFASASTATMPCFSVPVSAHP